MASNISQLVKDDESHLLDLENEQKNLSRLRQGVKLLIDQLSDVSQRIPYSHRQCKQVGSLIQQFYGNPIKNRARGKSITDFVNVQEQLVNISQKHFVTEFLNDNSGALGILQSWMQEFDKIEHTIKRARKVCGALYNINICTFDLKRCLTAFKTHQKKPKNHKFFNKKASSQSS